MTFTSIDYDKFRALRVTHVATRFEELIGDEANDAFTPEQLFLTAVDDALEQRRIHKIDKLALMSIAQHFGRPSTPTDQAWIETLWGHLKWEHPHLMTITDPAILAAELERLRHHYKTVHYHEAIGYVTPNDEHEGRGEQIRAARIDGLKIADEQRRDWHRNHRNQP